MDPDFNFPPSNGKCKGQDVAHWFPRADKGQSAEERAEYRRSIQFAVNTCEQCDVQDHCLEYSLRHEPFGIWGGKTEVERAMLRNDKKILLSREGRVFIPGIGKRNANGFIFNGSKFRSDSVAKEEALGG